MFNSLQTQEALKNPKVTSQNLAAYRSPMSPNPTVRPEDAEAEELRRANMTQQAMGMQALEAMGSDPSQTPSIMAKMQMENAQLKRMLAQMQRQPQPQAPGLAGLPAPSAERGYAGGGIVAFKDGGDVAHYQSQGLVALPERYRKDEYSSFFGLMPGRNERLGGASGFNQAVFEEDVRELERLKSGLSSGSVTNPAAMGKLVSLERDVAAGRAYLEGVQRQQAAVVPDEAKVPTPGAPTTQRREAPRNRPAPGGGPGLASIRGTPVPIGGDEPSAATQVADEQRGEGILGLAQAQEPVGPEMGPAVNREARMRQTLAERKALLEEMGIKGNAGDALREQIEEMKATQAKQKQQAGLAGLASTLAAFGSAPRKRAAGAAASAASQFITGQQAQEQRFNETIAAMKANALEKDRAEKRGDVTAVVAAEQENERLKIELEKIRLSAQLGSEENRRGEVFKERLVQMDIRSRKELSDADNRVKVQIASMAPQEFRTLMLLTEQLQKTDPNATVLDVLTAKSDKTPQLLAAWNNMSRAEKAKYDNSFETFKTLMGGKGAGDVPPGVTVKEK